MVVKDVRYPFTLSPHQWIKYAKLSNGQAVLHGTIDAFIEGKAGTSILTIGFIYGIDNDKAYLTAMVSRDGIGGIGLIFGQDNYFPDEVRNLAKPA
ncbi:MAG: hypothetical protein H5U02_14760 [Clostridia bacterium]|nr:hypothetical protein [Clostridia bacterium]